VLNLSLRFSEVWMLRVGRIGVAVGIAGCVFALSWSVPFARAQADKADSKKTESNKTEAVKPAGSKSDKDKSDKDKASKDKREKQEIRRGERTHIEARCLAFAREHHPELADLLDRLASMDETQFRKAIADLHRDVDRLDKLRDKFPVRHGSELKRWKIESRIRLLAARGAMSDSPEYQAELRAAVAERIDLKAAQLAEEKAQIEARLRKIDESMAELDKDREKLINGEVARLRKSAGSATSVRKNSPATTAKPAPRPESGS
jgi:hypothetical protein